MDTGNTYIVTFYSHVPPSFISAEVLLLHLVTTSITLYILEGTYVKLKIRKTSHNTTQNVHGIDHKNIYIDINTIPDSYFCSCLVNNSADTLHFHLTIITPKNDITGISRQQQLK